MVTLQQGLYFLSVAATFPIVVTYLYKTTKIDWDYVLEDLEERPIASALSVIILAAGITLVSVTPILNLLTTITLLGMLAAKRLFRRKDV